MENRTGSDFGEEEELCSVNPDYPEPPDTGSTEVLSQTETEPA